MTELTEAISPIFQMRTHPVSATFGNYPNILHSLTIQVAMVVYGCCYFMLTLWIFDYYCEPCPSKTVNSSDICWVSVSLTIGHFSSPITLLSSALSFFPLLSSPLLCPTCLWRHNTEMRPLNPTRPSNIMVKESYTAFFKSTARNAQLRKAYWKSCWTKSYTS